VALAHGFGGVDAPVSVALAHPPNPSTTGVLTEVVEGAADAALAPSGARARSGIDAGASDFERVWRAFPKRVGRAAARKAFDTVMARGVVSVEVLVDKVQEYKAATAHFSDPKYIKQLANWFKDECWLEEWEPPRRKQPKLDRAEKANGKAKPAEAAKPELDDGDDGPPTFEVGARAWRDGRKGEIVRASHELFDDGEWRWLVDVQWPEGSTSLNLSGDDLIVEPLTPEDRAERARRAAEAQAAAEAQRARRAAEAEAAAEAERARRAAEEQAAAAKRERELAEMRERFPVGARVDRTWSRCGVSHVKKDGEVIAVGPDGVQVRNGTSNSTVPYEHIVRGELVVTSAAPRGATPGM
jgi:hypothetical protein